MIQTAVHTAYKAFGFRIRSAIPLPELPTAGSEDGPEEITVDIADISRLLEGYDELQRSKYIVDRGYVLFHVPQAAIFRVEGGNKITLWPDDDADPDKIRLFLLGSCMGILLMQRKVLPLHGSAIAIGGSAYAIVGDSGAGKSTLASEFIGRGYPLVSDDVIPVTFSPGQQPLVHPAYPQQKLWQESLDHFGMESSRFRPIFDRETKYSVPVASSFSSDPLPLAGVFELVKTADPQWSLKRISRLESLSVLYSHTYRNFFLHRLGLTAWHFEATAALAGRIGCYRLERPASGFTAPELASLLLSTIGKEDRDDEQK